ncbi:MAG: MarR family transcriptional regulator [Pseudomonadota bacterium]
MHDDAARMYFRFFNEIGIIGQLSRALFEARLPDGLLVSHFSVVNHLVRLGDGRTPLNIAQAFQVPKTTMTHTLSILEKHGFVEMVPNPDDGRSKLVKLTDAGRAFQGEAIERLGPDMLTMSEEIPAKRIAEIVPLLEEVRQYLDANRP